jgi:hypothetical protein
VAKPIVSHFSSCPPPPCGVAVTTHPSFDRKPADPQACVSDIHQPFLPALGSGSNFQITTAKCCMYKCLLGKICMKTWKTVSVWNSGKYLYVRKKHTNKLTNQQKRRQPCTIIGDAIFSEGKAMKTQGMGISSQKMSSLTLD